MTLIFTSLAMSLSVAMRMIVPILVIIIASPVIWALVSIPTAGYSGYLSPSVTATLISLYGIRMAFAVRGDIRGTDFKILILYAVIYGTFFFVVLGFLVVLANFAGVLFATWQTGTAMSLSAIKDTALSTPLAFTIFAVSGKLIVAFVALTLSYVLMAVPLASAAQAAGSGAPSKGFFYGVGQSFLPLLCIFSVAFFAQIFLEMFTFFFALIPLVLSVFSLVMTQSLPDFDAELILKGLASGIGLLWLNAWVWSASALALLKYDGGSVAPRRPTATPEPEASIDIRALRKSRE